MSNPHHFTLFRVETELPGVGPFCPSPTKGSMLHFKISEKIESKVYHCAVFKLLNFY